MGYRDELVFLFWSDREAWAKAYHDALHPQSAGGAYVNMMMDEGRRLVLFDAPE